MRLSISTRNRCVIYLTAYASRRRSACGCASATLPSRGAISLCLYDAHSLAQAQHIHEHISSGEDRRKASMPSCYVCVSIQCRRPGHRTLTWRTSHPYLPFFPLPPLLFREVAGAPKEERVEQKTFSLTRLPSISFFVKLLSCHGPSCPWPCSLPSRLPGLM